MSKTKTLDLLACDPGAKDYGIALLRIHSPGKAARVEVLKVGKLNAKYTVNSMEELPAQFASYKKGLDLFCGKIKPQAVVIERFMGRGLRGALGEKISFMVCLTLEKYTSASITVFPIAASSWKNCANKRLAYTTKELYKRYNKQLEPHEIDAVLMGIYIHDKIYKREPYVGLSSRSALIQFIARIVKAKGAE